MLYHVHVSISPIKLCNGRVCFHAEKARERHVLKRATIKGKNMLPFGEHILSFNSSPNENRKQLEKALN